MSDTPRTDAIIEMAENGASWEDVAVALAKECQKLERELAAAKAEMDSQESRYRELIMWDECRQAIAEMKGYNDNDAKEWPTHNNGPLAVMAAFALMKCELDAVKAKLDALRAKGKAVVEYDFNA